MKHKITASVFSVSGIQYFHGITKNIFNSSNSSPLYQNQLRCDVYKKLPKFERHERQIANISIITKIASMAGGARWTLLGPWGVVLSEILKIADQLRTMGAVITPCKACVIQFAIYEYIRLCLFSKLSHSWQCHPEPTWRCF